MLFVVGCRSAADGVGRPRVKLAAELKCQSPVGTVAQEAVTKGQRSGVVTHDELLQLLPGGVVGSREVVDHLCQQINRERLPEDGHPAQETARVHRQSVDTSGGHLLDGVREALDVIPVQGRSDQLPEEERIASRPCDQQRQFALGQGGILGGGASHFPCGLLTQRPELDPGGAPL